MPEPTKQFSFEGHAFPNYTPVPNEFFDVLISELSGNELKALLYIYRRTFGFQRWSDSISFNQFLTGITTQDGRVLDKGGGITNRTRLSDALKSLQAKGVIRAEKSTTTQGDAEVTVYTPVFKGRVVPNRHHGSTDPALPVVPNGYLQCKVTQDKGLQTSNSKVATAKVQSEEPSGTGGGLPRTPQRTGGLEPIAETLRRRSPKASTDDPLAMEIRSLSEELGDAKHYRSNMSQAKNLLDEAGLELVVFLRMCHECRSVVRQEQGVRNRAAYFFEVLRGKLAITTDPSKPNYERFVRT